MGKKSQKNWDALLIKGWELDWAMGRVFAAFVDKDAQILYKLKDRLRSFRYMRSLNLKRFPAFLRDSDGHDLGSHVQFISQLPVKAYLQHHSKQMSGCLWSEKINNSDVLENIENFNWDDAPPVNRNARARHHRAYIKSQTKKIVSLRAGDKNHDWKTVK